ncbi:MAG: T9SS type A sorting domain-containing protein [Lentimicrobium sp.]|nr:T9SS type A sorting domain-containing protein [Lentimicrobium sp.]
MRNSIFFGLLCILLFISLFFWQDAVELLGEEPRSAIVSLEMQLTGDYLVPRINGMNYYNKPPLFNWIMSAFFSLTGSHEEWVVRLPSLLGWIGLAILLFFIVRRFMGKEVALLSTLFTLTAADVYFFGTVFSGEIDLFYSFVIFLQIISLFWFYSKQKYLWMFIASYLFAGIGFLTKGLPSVAFQALTLLGMAIVYRGWKWLFSWQHLTGILFLILPVGFYYFLYSQKADHLSYLFNLVKEASQRTGLESKPVDFLLSIFKFPVDLIKDYTVQSNADWCKIVSTYAGNDNIKLLFEENMLDFDRSALITVFPGGSEPVTFSLIQSGRNANPALADQMNVQLFPNPSEGIFKLLISNPDKKEIQVMISDILGRPVYSRTFSGDVSENIDLKKDGTGIFEIMVSKENSIQRKSIIIQ